MSRIPWAMLSCLALGCSSAHRTIADAASADTSIADASIADPGSVASADASSDASIADPGSVATDAGSDSSPAGDDDAGVVEAGDGALCDGSDDVRLAVQVFSGYGLATDRFSMPDGSFLFVDGKCHYYAASNYMSGIAEGDLDQMQAAQLQRDLGWSHRIAWQGWSPARCFDGGTTTVAMQDAAFACSCDQCGASEPGKTQAVERATQLIPRLVERSKKLSGAVSARAYLQSQSDVPILRPWPLDRTPVSIPGLVDFDPDLESDGGARFEGQDADVLRALRADELRSDPSAPFVMVESENIYSLYVRDELPESAATALRAFMERARARF